MQHWRSSVSEKASAATAMKKILIQSAIFLGLLLLVTLLNLPYDQYAEDLVQSVQRQLRTGGVAVEVEKTDVSFPGEFTLGNVSLLLPTRPLPVPLFIDQIIVSPRILRIFLLQGAVDGNIQAYEGQITASLIYRLLSGNKDLTVRGQTLQLSGHPLFKALGVSGVLNLNAESQISQEKVPPGAANDLRQAVLLGGASSAHISLEHGEYQGGHKLQGLIELPAAKEISLTVTVEQKKKRIVLNQLELFSSLGSATGSGSIVVTQTGKLQRANLRFSLQLTAEGNTAFGGYLALAARMSPESPPRNWEIQIAKRERYPEPQIIVTPG